MVTDAYGGRGGIANYNRCLIAALARIESVAEVVVLPLTHEQQPLPDKVRVVTGANGSRFRFLVRLAGQLTGKYDLLICGHMGLILPAALVRGSARLVLQVHGIDAWQPPGWLKRKALSRVHRIWAVSQFTGEKMNAWAKRPQDDYEVIPNTVRLEAFGTGAARSDLVERFQLAERKVVLSLGRLSAEEQYKGVDQVIEAMPDLLIREPDLVYLVCGDGDDMSRLKKKVRQAGLGDHVRFAGWIDDDEKADYLRLADVMVLAGWGEGFGIVLLEAMACGIPVVASRLDGSREAVRDGDLGAVVDPRNRAEIIDAVVNALVADKTVPPGIGYFGWDRFCQRVGRAVRSVAS